jgi:hypothetical protein
VKRVGVLFRRYQFFREAFCGGDSVRKRSDCSYSAHLDLTYYTSLSYYNTMARTCVSGSYVASTGGCQWISWGYDITYPSSDSQDPELLTSYPAVPPYKARPTTFSPSSQTPLSSSPPPLEQPPCSTPHTLGWRTGT